MTYNASRFIERLKLARQSRGWTLWRMAAETGLSKTYVWEIERGGKNVSVETLARLCKAFELRADYLLFGE